MDAEIRKESVGRFTAEKGNYCHVLINLNFDIQEVS
jgi:hypothetical protein